MGGDSKLDHIKVTVIRDESLTCTCILIQYIREVYLSIWTERCYNTAGNFGGKVLTTFGNNVEILLDSKLEI